MSTEVKRHPGRTYGRVSDTAASRAFDDIFSKSKTTNLKWGNASFSKTRTDGEHSDAKRAAEERGDPFSFEFDEDRSPKKRRLVAATAGKPVPQRTVVMQPAVRIVTPKQASSPKPAARINTKSALAEEDEAAGEDLVVRKVPTKTYTRRASRKLKEEHDVSQLKMDLYVKSEENSSQKQQPEQSGSEVDLTATTEDDELYIEKDDGSELKNADVDITQDEEDIFKHKPSTRMVYESKPDSPDSEDTDPVTVTFRSKYLDPDVYSKFTHNTLQKDPIGRLSNSKVVHKSELKHDNGTTLIVVCSPKSGDSEYRQTNLQSKYFKDCTKEMKKSSAKHREALPEEPAVKDEDPYALEDDEPDVSEKTTPVNSSQASVITISSTDTPAQSQEVEDTPSSSSSGKNPTEARTTRSAAASKPRNPAATVKYHRIFRSRNKGMTDSSQGTLSSQESTAASEDTAKTDSEPAITISESQESVRTEEELVAEEMEQVEAEKDSLDTSSQDEEMPQLRNAHEDSPACSDIDSSQQSTGDVETPNSQESSQELRPKKTRANKPPPVERKIFRSRGSRVADLAEGGNGQKKIFQSPKKSAAVYNVRSWQDEEDAAGSSTGNRPPGTGPPRLRPIMKKTSNKDDKDIPAEPPTLTRAVHWPDRDGDEAFTSVHVTKEHKELFTVVKNVKDAHLVQEFGENQEFDDAIDYLLVGIKDIEPLSVRCLSCISLAQKCIIPAFRMHLRAHGTVTKIFGCLQDAASDPSLALCASALMFMLSRDRLNMDLDQDSLNLMLRLLGVDQQEDMATTLSPSATRTLNRNMDRVREVYEQFQKEPGSKSEIDIDSISTGNLAMESLLSLTSRRAGEWFKEELRSLGALDHIVDTVCSCVEAVGDDVQVLTNSSLENLKKVDRCLRVLENVTYLNADNQTYLISYKSAVLVSSLCRALRVCEVCLAVYPLSESVETGKVDKESFGWVVYSCIVAILRVLLNLTHDNEFGCTKIGEQDHLVEIVLLCILQAPQHVPVDLRFDLFVLSLGLLINLVEHCDLNRRKLIEMKTQPTFENNDQDEDMMATLSLVEVFRYREQAARQLEEDEPTTPEPSPNKSGEWKESDSGMEWVINSGKKDKSNNPTPRPGAKRNGVEEPGKDLDDEETFTKALHKAGKHMENSIIAAYVSLLVGCLIQDNSKYAEQVKNHLPDKNFDSMIYMLKKFLGFMNLTSDQGSTGGKSISRVIEILEAY